MHIFKSFVISLTKTGYTWLISLPPMKMITKHKNNVYMCSQSFKKRTQILWVPKMLKEKHKNHRAACALTFLMCYHKEGDSMLSHVVTGDETWVSHITPDSKQQSLHWKHTGSPKRKKFKQTFSTRKIMCTILWDRQGVLLVEFLPQGTTINCCLL